MSIRCLSIAGVFALLFLGCAGTPAPVTSKAPPLVAEPAPIPPCPEAILPGGDPLEAESFESKPVVRVCVVGGSAESRKSIERVGLFKVGDTFSIARVRADLAGIMALGTFEDAAAFGLRVRDGTSLVLFYSLRDRPRVAQIGFEGAKVLGDAALSAKLPIERGTPYDPARTTVIAQAVREEYRQRGYDATRVVVVTEPVPGPDGTAMVRVSIKVDEGPLARLSKVEFRGNKKVTDADLRKVAALKVGQPYVRDEVDRAALLLSALMFDRGLVQMRVDAETGARDASGALPLTFVIDEGEVYSIGSLHVTKAGAPFEKELLEKVIKARTKQTFSRSALVEDLARVKAFFTAKGQNVEVLPLTNIDDKKRSVDLTLEVEGSR